MCKGGGGGGGGGGLKQVCGTEVFVCMYIHVGCVYLLHSLTSSYIGDV